MHCSLEKQQTVRGLEETGGTGIQNTNKLCKDIPTSFSSARTDAVFCTPAFTASLFTVAKIEKSPVPIDRYMGKDVVHTHMEYYLAIKKETLQLPTWWT